MNFPYLNESGLINTHTIVPEKSAYPLSPSNMGQILVCSPTAPLTINIPIGLPKNFYCAFLKTAAFNVALTPASGVTLSSAVEDDGISTITTDFQLVELVMWGNNLFVASGFGNAGGDAAIIPTYAALLTQSGTGAPVATVLFNTLGGTPVWTRSGAGSYIATLAGAFPAKTAPVSQAVYNANSGVFNAMDGIRATSDLFNLDTYAAIDLTTKTDDILNGTLISIIAYP